MDVRHPFEPFRIKVVEALRLTSRDERLQLMKQAGYNPFMLKADDILIDLLTDSGFTAMSDTQWAGVMVGDESYAGSRSFYHLEQAVEDIFGSFHFVPVHQGRGAESILFEVLTKPGQLVPGNAHFTTTRSNIEKKGAIAVDLAVDEAYDSETAAPFKGSLDLGKLDHCFSTAGSEQVPLVLTTITNNTCGGHPVSMANLRETHKMCHSQGVPFFLDAARFAENAYFIKLREPGYARIDLLDIIHEMFSYADGFVISSKKDGLVNIGGLLGVRDERLFKQVCAKMILQEGYITYGGLAGRDLEAMSIGLREGTKESFLAYRLGQVEYLHSRLDQAGIPVVRPYGGHAVYVDAGRFLPHIAPGEFPAAALTARLYVDGGIRANELGNLAFGKSDDVTGEVIFPKLDLVRLTIPRRVYTQSQLDYVADVLGRLHADRGKITGLKLVEEPEYLRHYTARLQPVDEASWN